MTSKPLSSESSADGSGARLIASAVRTLEIEASGITTLSAAATHYRMVKTSGAAPSHRYAVRKLSFTGEPMDGATRAFTEATFGVPVCSMYGTTEVGVVLADYPGAPDYVVKPGALGRPVPGVQVAVQRPDGTPCPPGEPGEIVVWRRGAWFPTRDRGYVDADGYFFYHARTDDMIVSAGYNISGFEVEEALLHHISVRECAVVGTPDPERGQVVTAYIVLNDGMLPDDTLTRSLQDFVKTTIAPYKYPRVVEYLEALPRTSSGKVQRHLLRQRSSAS